MEYSLEEMREVLDVLAEFSAGPASTRRAALTQQLAGIRSAAADHRDKLAAAETFIDQLDEHSRRG